MIRLRGNHASAESTPANAGSINADVNLDQIAREAGQLGPDGPRNPLLEIYVETTRSILAHIDQGIHQKTE